MKFKQIQNNWNTALTQRDRDTVKLRLLLVFAGIGILVCLMGCGPNRLDPIIAKNYEKMVTSMRSTYDHIADRFAHYINGDYSLDQFAQMNFRMSLAVWENWITRGEKTVEELKDADILRKVR